MLNLVIVESPTKVKTITKFLPKDFVVEASVGHVRDLPKKKLGINVKENFDLEYEISKDKKSVISKIKELAKKADTIYLAPDPDREGEAIAWHIYEILKNVTKANFQRVTFNEITKSAVQKAFDNSGDIDYQRVDAQQTRRALDRLVGYKVSPILWKRGAKSAGRVQTVALNLIVEREKKILEFQPEEYWIVEGDFSTKINPGQLTLKLVQIDKKKIQIKNEKESKFHKVNLEKSHFSISDIYTKTKVQQPPFPFITSTLQQTASSRLGFSPIKTMRIAQQLYEGVDINGETVGLITYMRTDSFNLSAESKLAAKEYISKEFGENYLGVPKKVKTSNKLAQEAHEAIRPSHVNLSPKSIEANLSSEQYRLYNLIWRRFLMSQMQAAKLNIHTIEIVNTPEEVSHQYLFRNSVSELAFEGYLVLEKESSLHKNNGIDFSSYKKSISCRLEKLDLEQKFTEPPPRFSEASLIKELEKNGVGRPSTYASIVKVIQDREYVNKNGSQLKPTPIGVDTSGYLSKSLAELFAVGFTAKMEQSLDEIEQGNQKFVAVIESFYKNLISWIENIKKIESHPLENFDKLIKHFTVAETNLDFSWEEPTKIGRRILDDKKFIDDLKNSIENKNLLSEKQWQYLLSLVVKYKKFFINYEELKNEFAINDVVQVDEKDLELLTLLEQIKFEENDAFDEKSFVESLRAQIKIKALSLKQSNVLKRITSKYRDQIANYEDIAQKHNLKEEVQSVLSEDLKKFLEKAFSLSNNIEWKEPTKKGKFVYDDKKFFKSLSDQYSKKKTLSDKQINALKRTLKKYENQNTQIADLF